MKIYLKQHAKFICQEKGQGLIKLEFYHSSIHLTK